MIGKNEVCLNDARTSALSWPQQYRFIHRSYFEEVTKARIGSVKVYGRGSASPLYEVGNAMTRGYGAQFRLTRSALLFIVEDR